jgi:hypothetical protein
LYNSSWIGQFYSWGCFSLYILKVCRCCDAIIGEIEFDSIRKLKADKAMELSGNVAYSLCPQCMRELEISNIRFYQ